MSGRNWLLSFRDIEVVRRAHLDGTLRAAIQDATRALAQPAEIQLRLLPSFIRPGPYLLYQFLLSFENMSQDVYYAVSEEDPFEYELKKVADEIAEDELSVSPQEEAVLQNVQEAIVRLFKSVPDSVYFPDGSDTLDSIMVQNMMRSLIYSPEEMENSIGLLSSTCIQASPEWQEIRQISKEALRQLEWPDQYPSVAWQPNSVPLKGGFSYCEEGSPGIYENYEVQVVPEDGNLLVEHSYTDDPHLGTKWHHWLSVEAVEKANMLSLLTDQHNAANSLVPSDVHLLDLIYIKFYTLQQLGVWLGKHAIPFTKWHEQIYPL